MPNPSDEYVGRSTVTEATSRDGVAQLVRTWEADAPKASALVLHGIAEHSGRYEHVGSALADAGYTTVGYDHHGHGKSGGQRGHVPGFEVFLDDVEDRLAALRDDGLPVVMLGHSMGGLIAFRYAVSDRPQPDVLLLSGPALGAVVPAWQRIAAPILGRIAPRVFIKSEFEPGLLSTDPDVGFAYEADPLRVKGATARLGHELFEAMQYANEHIDRLRVPTLVVHGADDPIVPPEFSAPIGDRPEARRTVIEGMKHEVLNEPNWEETMEHLVEFADEALAALDAAD